MSKISVIVWIFSCWLLLINAISNAADYNPNSFQTNNNSSLQYNETCKEEWYYDLWNLPSEVPYPGIGWLSRMASSMPSSELPAALLMYRGRQYNNVYEAIVFSLPSTLSATSSTTSSSQKSPNRNDRQKSQNEQLLNHPCRNLNAYINSVLIPPKIAQMIVHYLAFDNIEVGHYLLCYIRNFVASLIIYYGVGLLFHYGCYVYYGRTVFDETGRRRPTKETILNQIRLSQSSLFLYVLLPVIDEYLIENDYTYVYYTIAEIGGYMNYVICQTFYFVLVEIGIYWMHRTLHTNKWMYMNIHLKHHQYKTVETLTPWASIAFHPLDGLLQASPYVIVLFIAPCHYVTHLLLLFFTAIWAAYIHDAMEWNVFPIMGSKYHTVHHTHYIYNYGQIFIFCDYFWNTLYLPSKDKNENKQFGNHVDFDKISSYAKEKQQ